MSDNIRLNLVLVLVVVGLFGEKVVNWAKDNVEIVDGTVYTITEPSLENKELVKLISETDIELKDAELISAFYLELADVIDKDDTIIDSTEQFRNSNTFAGVLHFNTSLLGNTILWREHRLCDCKCYW